MFETEEKKQRALLVSVDTGTDDAQASMDELYELTRSADAEPVASLIQKRPAPDTATCVGSGMLQDIAQFCKSNEVDLLIFDCELSPTQIRNIEEETNVRVIDRTILILDIFAARARSREGKLQVELAQLQYLLPRLTGKGLEMSRLGGGIGTRGPGETKLETDRRHIRRKIETLKAQLAEVEKQRNLTKRQRRKSGVQMVALVGYTNAGKSTLMNRLTEAGVLAEDKLFATLDPTVRALKLPGGAKVLLTDTVGLVRRLPHQLVQAFHSTLEQAAEADVILNICDASSPEARLHLEVTRNLLSELGCGDRPIISVLNKCDRVPELQGMQMVGRKTVRISALTGEGIDALLEAVEEALPEKMHQVTLLLPFSEGALSAEVRREGSVSEEIYTEDGLRMRAAVSARLLVKLEPFILPSDEKN